MNKLLFYEEMGNGAIVTLLHGYPLDHSIWLETAEELKTKARVILPDLRGHGRSYSPAGKYAMQAMAADVVALLDELKIEKTVIGGHSMGGYVALAMARHFPERLSGLVLIASHAYADLPGKKEERLASIDRIIKEGPDAILSSMPAKLSYNNEIVEHCRSIMISANPIGVMGVLAGMAERPDSMDILSGSNLPMMIIAGTSDQIVPLETSRSMAAGMARPWLVEISGSGHMPMLEQPTQVATALLDFIFAS